LFDYIISHFSYFQSIIDIKFTHRKKTRAEEPERPEPHNLAGAGTGAEVGTGAILFFLQEPEREPEQFKKLE